MSSSQFHDFGLVTLSDLVTLSVDNVDNWITEKKHIAEGDEIREAGHLHHTGVDLHHRLIVTVNNRVLTRK